MAVRRTSPFLSLLLLSASALCGEDSNVAKPIDLFGSRLPSKQSTPTPPPANRPPAAPGTTSPDAPAKLTRPHSGPVQPYDRLARDNIHVSAYILESGSAGMKHWVYYWSHYRHRTVTQNKLVEILLSGIGNKGGDVTVQCYSVIRRNGGGEVVAKVADQDIINDGVGKWCVTLEATRTEYQYSYYNRRTYTSGEKIVGFFVRVIRDGRIVGYSSSPIAYERFALDTSL